MKRFLILTSVLAVTAAGAASPATGAVGASADKKGAFSKPFAEIPLFAKRPPKNVKESLKSPPAVSMAVLPSGKIVYWGGLEGIENNAAPVALDGRSNINSRVRILDIRNGKPTFEKAKPEDGGAHDMFCADLRLTKNGDLVVVGGTLWHSDPVNLRPVLGPDGPTAGTLELFGSNAVRTFDDNSGKWTVNRDWMQEPRWYPTMITQPNGELLITSGVGRLIYNYSGQNVHALEYYDPDTSKVKAVKGDSDISLPLFPRLHLMPDGTVFYGGVGQMWGPFGQAVDEAMWAVHRTYNPKKRAWTTAGMGAYGARSGAFSILLPLKAPYKSAKVLIGGGTLGSSPGSYIANNFTEIVTVKKGASSSEEGPALNNRRWYSSGVLLPDGDVVALSGADRDEVILPGAETPVRQAELFTGKKWVPLDTAGRIRTYHNTAVLLADGSILVGGHAPINNGYGPKGDNSTEPLTGTNNLKDPSFEIFKPPYLFRGNRPSIASVQRGIGYGGSFKIGTGDASKIDKVVLSRLPTTTHITDADQRSIELDFRTDGNSLKVHAPPHGAVAPPGYYYLWILSDNGQGLTPSKARIVQVGRTIGGEATAPMGR